MHAATPKTLILASSSHTRQELLGRLHLPFACISPNIDETPQSDEHANAIVTRLAREKADKIAKVHRNAWVIGSDQLAVLDGEIFGKPADLRTAFAQLRAMSGKVVHWLNGVCLMNHASESCQELLSEVEVVFRSMDDAEIQRYLEKDAAVLDCAGSFHSEAFGSALVERISSDDPSALLGLPLIGLCGLLRGAGFALP
ncbi:MAG: Maf family protein [Candidatus Eutrophobiaceae bacterium]